MAEYRSSAPITVEVLCAIGPVLIFAGQMVEGRVPASAWTLAAILAYAGLSAAGALLRGVSLPVPSFSRQS